MADATTMNNLESPVNTGAAVALEARGALSADADLSGKTFISPADQEKYGLKIRESGGKLEAYFHAGGKDNVVATQDAGSTPAVIEAKLEQLAASQMKTLQDKYKVTFASPGESVAEQIIHGSDCHNKSGPMIYAKQATFADLYAVSEALAHSAPSQLTADGQTGTKLYFLDKSIFAQPAYGDKPALAVYISSDKNKQIAVYVTPDGEKLPITGLDTSDPQARNLAYVMEHEFTHNSQKNMWPNWPFLPDKLPESFGWQTINRMEKGGKVVWENYRMEGKSGEYYVNTPLACGKNTAWLELKNDKLIGKDGMPTKDTDQVAQFTNDQVSANAQVKPVTYYFPNPTEMLSEGLANYRTTKESRMRLYKESPQLYDVARKYDDQEIAHVYGVDNTGRSNYLRTPDGIVVPRTDAAAAELQLFEQSLAK